MVLSWKIISSLCISALTQQEDTDVIRLQLMEYFAISIVLFVQNLVCSYCHLVGLYGRLLLLTIALLTLLYSSFSICSSAAPWWHPLHKWRKYICLAFVKCFTLINWVQPELNFWEWLFRPWELIVKISSRMTRNWRDEMKTREWPNGCLLYLSF